ncbi:terminase small subunit [Glaciecola siphonariae]|uniref:Terminase small subunit n=1 Tax=Glaciecola siphonariae TaxID=521012 RepID=A0ABV9LT96_9ALTE
MEPHLLNKKNMAASCGISVQGFDKWNVRPFKKKGREQFYRVEDVIENRVNNELTKNNNRTNPEHHGQFIDIEMERALLTQQQRITQEIKNEILEGRAIPVEFVRDVLAKILAQVGSTLDSLAPNIKRRHPEIEKRIIDFIKSETIKHQNEAANLDSHIDDIIDEVVNQAEAKI